ncbi:MAG: S-methyl-5-thioribose-1-phosphate isomerase [Deferrisomatales bacterium]|nr:S-methyl-5-thioribose-1-phosphate isomerase [Deferrisomatales bacterium]
MRVEPIRWRDGTLSLLDQTLLPTQTLRREYRDYRQVARAIETMVVRGAPAIGVTAAYGVALAARELSEAGATDWRPGLDAAIRTLAATRPTAVNLFWALERMGAAADRLRGETAATAAAALAAEAEAIRAADVAANRRLGAHGAALLPDPCTVLTHCNAGALATAGYGTALGVVRAAKESGKRVRVVADETRPLLQGARLTAWELAEDDIDVTLISDNMAGYRLQRGGVDAVVVGADRVAANGDAANKIGTYPLAVLAREHGVPFYIAAPLSTVDFATASGAGIPIEQRDHREVTHLAGQRVAPQGISVWNPAFDVTPAALITAIVTEAGVARAPYGAALAALRDAAQAAESVR